MSKTQLRQIGRVYWMGGPGGGGDPAANAATQYQFNQQAAMLGQKLNQYNVSSPGGSTTFKGNTLVEKLSPQGKRVFKAREAADLALAQGAQRQAAEANRYAMENAPRLSQLRQAELGSAESRARSREQRLGQIESQGQFDPSKMFAEQGVTDLSNVDRYGQREQDLGRKSVEDAMLSRLNPQFDRDRQALEARSAAQGIAPGSEAYRTNMDELNRANTDARFQAVLAGGQEQSRQEGLRQTELERRRGLRQQLLEEQLTRRGIPYNELQNIEA